MTAVIPIETVFPDMKEFHDSATRAAKAMYEISPIKKTDTWENLDDTNKGIWVNMAKEAAYAGKFVLKKKVENDRLLIDLSMWIDFLEKGFELDGADSLPTRNDLIATLMATMSVVQDVERYNATVRSALIVPENYRECAPRQEK